MRTKLIAGLILAAVVAVALLFGSSDERDGGSSIAIPDLAQHPIYSQYEFGGDSSVIDLGAQPLYLPTGLITEAMRRDLILARELRRLGLKVRYHSFLKGGDVNSFLQTEDLEIGIGGDMPTLLAAANLEATVAALIQRGYTSIVANRYMSVSDLRGAAIGFVLNSNAHYTLLRTLAADGLDESQVELVAMEISQMPGALHRGEIDAFAGWEPTVTVSLIRHPASRVMHRNLSSGYLYFRKQFAQEQPEAVRHIVAAEIRAIHWMQDDRRHLLEATEWAIDASEQLAGRSYELSTEETATLAERDILSRLARVGIPERDLLSGRRLEEEFELMASLGKIDPSVTWKEVAEKFDLTIVRAVQAASEDYRLEEFDYAARPRGR